MAFFDDIGKKISRAGKPVLQKTKDVVDIARINAAIADEEKMLEEMYIALGKRYVDIHVSDEDEVSAKLIMSVQECIARIAEYRQQIKVIRGVIVCKRCGSEIPLGHSFCGSCGVAVEHILVSDKVSCAKCGAMVDKTMRFCTSCGNPMVESAPTTQPTPDEELSASAKPVSEPVAIVKPPAVGEITPAAVEPTPVCIRCGAPLLVNAAFCVECGAPIDASASQPTVATCSNCGTALLDGALFCTECGTEL